MKLFIMKPGLELMIRSNNTRAVFIIICGCVCFAAAQFPAKPDTAAYNIPMRTSAQNSLWKRGAVVQSEPDTITFFFQCGTDIIAEHPWDSLLWLHTGTMDSVPLTVLGAPSPSSNNMAWTFLIDIDEQSGSNVTIDTRQFKSSCRDIVYALREVVIGEQDYFKEYFYTTAQNDTNPLPRNDLMGKYNVNTKMWVPPSGLRKDGTVSSTCAEAEPGRRTGFPTGCLSALMLFVVEPYTATIRIYDNLGKFINSSVQSFGKCGELNDTERKTPYGMMSDLVWNQTDYNGNFVGSGVYIWNVQLEFDSGNIQQIYKKQGIYRDTSPERKKCFF